MLLVFWLCSFFSLSAFAETHGQVFFGGVPVPGATVTVTQGEKKFTAITDAMGMYIFPDLPDGTLAVEIEMRGFAKLKGDTSTSLWELKMLPMEEMKAEVAHVEPAPAASAEATAPAASRPVNVKSPPAPANRQSGVQRPERNESANANSTTQPGAESPATSSAFANASPEELNQRAADGLLINGWVNNGAARPFAQLGGFGNNRRGLRPLYNGGIGLIIDNSSLDARSFSLTGQDTVKPAYNNVRSEERRVG